ncbi:DUF2336 domain-containing protein [Bradyrhizobium sp.]|uniref:DUF2336 domain-containing protein n=1 Tax=Bradyrhizobium sp. TaxID=376 RepID=UPI0025C60E65|nr:DUF2336 domain-containing protein [Bradyrhizobium sp.]
MIVRHFLHWLRTAGPAERAEATAVLARVYLYSDLSDGDRAASESALIMQLDDPEPSVREALARALAFSDQSPPPVILGLAADQPEIASWVLEHSPLLMDADLVDAVATGQSDTQSAIARRADLPCAVAAAIAEVGSAEACLVLIENGSAEIVAFSFDRMVERHGHLAAIREAMLAREDLPVATRQLLLAKLSEALAEFAVAQAWLGGDRAQRVAREACEKATVTLAAITPANEVPLLIQHLRKSGQLTAGLILRALLSGNVALFEQALAELAAMPLRRVSALLHDRRGSGFRALYDRAGLPASTYTAFREAVDSMREGGFVGDADGATRLRRSMVERVLTRCADDSIGDVAPLLLLLRRFVAEAAREEARMLCNEMVADHSVQPLYLEHAGFGRSDDQQVACGPDGSDQVVAEQAVSEQNDSELAVSEQDRSDRYFSERLAA